MATPVNVQADSIPEVSIPTPGSIYALYTRLTEMAEVVNPKYVDLYKLWWGKELLKAIEAGRMDEEIVEEFKKDRMNSMYTTDREMWTLMGWANMESKMTIIGTFFDKNRTTYDGIDEMEKLD